MNKILLSIDTSRILSQSLSIEYSIATSLKKREEARMRIEYDKERRIKSQKGEGSGIENRREMMYMEADIP